MPFDAYSAERIRQYFELHKVSFYEKKMMGGLCFMVNEKMCCGLHYDKKKQQHMLMVRIGATAQKRHEKKEGVFPMDFTGRPMKGFLNVADTAWDTETDLIFWLELCLAFNPLAKASKKKRAG